MLRFTAYACAGPLLLMIIFCFYFGIDSSGHSQERRCHIAVSSSNQQIGLARHAVIAEDESYPRPEQCRFVFSFIYWYKTANRI